MIEGVIFDKDGTLFDFRRSWAAWAASLLHELAGADIALAGTLAKAIGFQLEAQDFDPDSVVIAGTAAEVAELLLPHLPGQTLQTLLGRMNLLAADAPLAEVVPLRDYLTGLRERGLRLGLATNDAEAPAHAHLQRAGVLDLFDFVAGFDSGYGAKPAPGQLLAFCVQLRVDPARVVMVGDSLHDLHAAKRAGMHRVGVLTGIAKAEELKSAADVILADIGALPAWLDARAGVSRRSA